VYFFVLLLAYLALPSAGPPPRNAAANIYSFGMICHALLTRKSPFDASSNQQSMMQRIVQGR
jgi:hypothetical protein